MTTASVSGATTVTDDAMRSMIGSTIATIGHGGSTALMIDSIALTMIVCVASTALMIALTGLMTIAG